MPTEARLKLKLKKKHKLALTTSKNSKRTKNAEMSTDKDKSYMRANGSKGDFRKKVRTKEIQSGEEGRDGGFGEREKLRPLASNGKKRRVYAREETGPNGKSYNVTAVSKKKALLKKGDKTVKEEVAVARTSGRSTRVSSKLNNVSSEIKNSFRKVKVMEENIRLPNVKQRAKAKEAGKKESVMRDGNGTGFLKKHREQKSDFSEDKSQNVVPPSSSTKKKARVKAGLDDDVEITNEQPKKRKRVIKIDPYDISNKRLDDGIVISGW